MQTKIPLTIYGEATPNPASMKFVLNAMLVDEPGLGFEFRNASKAKDSPLAAKLFELPFVKGVFITANFVTVTQDENQTWYEIIPEIKALILTHLQTGGKVILPGSSPAIETVEPSGDLEKKIMDVLDEFVRPAVEGDGGAIEFKSFEKGLVTVSLRGSCSGCPSSNLTLKAGIENLLRRMVPEVEEVVAESL